MAADEWITIPADDDGEWVTVPTKAVSRSNTPGMVAGGLATGSALIPSIVSGGRRLVEEVATNPNVAGAGKRIAKMGGMPFRTMSTLKQVSDVVTGKQSFGGAVMDAARNEVGNQALTRAPGFLQRLALRAAPRLAGVSGVTASGALAGAAVPAALLAAMQHDQQRDHAGIIEDNPNSLSAQIQRALMQRQAADIELR